MLRKNPINLLDGRGSSRHLTCLMVSRQPEAGGGGRTLRQLSTCLIVERPAAAGAREEDFCALLVFRVLGANRLGAMGLTGADDEESVDRLGEFA